MTKCLEKARLIRPDSLQSPGKSVSTFLFPRKDKRIRGSADPRARRRGLGLPPIFHFEEAANEVANGTGRPHVGDAPPRPQRWRESAGVIGERPRVFRCHSKTRDERTRVSPDARWRRAELGVSGVTTLARDAFFFIPPPLGLINAGGPFLFIEFSAIIISHLYSHQPALMGPSQRFRARDAVMAVLLARPPHGKMGISSCGTRRQIFGVGCQ